MKVYLAARFSKRPIVEAWGKALEHHGFEIVSRWSQRDSDHKLVDGLSPQAEDSERQRFAIEDIEDIDKAHICLSLMEEPRNNSRGGRHIEFGYALGKGLDLWIVGPRETVFHHLPQVHCFDDWVDCFNAMVNYYNGN